MNKQRSSVWAAAIVAILAPGVARAQPRVPLVELNVDPDVLPVPQPCPTSTTVTLQIRNNAAPGGNAIDVDWSSAYILHTPECVADYSPKSGTELAIPAQGVRDVTITLTFIGDCEGETTIEFTGAIQGQPGDSDSRVLTVLCNEAIPTVSEWGLIILTLLLLTAGTIVIARGRRPAVV